MEVWRNTACTTSIQVPVEKTEKKQKNTWTKLTWEKCHFSQNWRCKFLNFTVKQNSWSCGWTEPRLAGWYPPQPLLGHECDLHGTEQDTHRWYLNYCSTVAQRVLAATRSVMALACFVNIVTIKNRCIYTSTLCGKRAPFLDMKHWCSQHSYHFLYTNISCSWCHRLKKGGIQSRLPKNQQHLEENTTRSCVVFFPPDMQMDILTLSIWQLCIGHHTKTSD